LNWQGVPLQEIFEDVEVFEEYRSNKPWSMSLGFDINPWGKNGMGWMMIDDMEKHVIQE
jgi:hypothetical protein